MKIYIMLLVAGLFVVTVTKVNAVECCSPSTRACSQQGYICVPDKSDGDPCSTGTAGPGLPVSGWHCEQISPSNPDFKLPKYADIGESLKYIASPEFAFTRDIGRLLTGGLQFFFAGVGLLFMVYLLYGGVTIISGLGNEQSVAAGQKIITRAIIGLLIMFVSFWIVELLELVLGIVIL